MRKKPFIFCGYVCILGIFGAFFRWLQNTTAFEVDTGLAVPFALWSIVMAVYIAACAVSLIFPAKSLPSENVPEDFVSAFGGKAAVVFRVASIVCLVLVSGSGAVMLLRCVRAGSLAQNLFNLVLGGGAFVSGICLFVLFRRLLAGESKGCGGPSVIIVLYLCFLLIWEYKTYASDPVVWHFAVRILSTAAVLLAYYYIAGFCYYRYKPRKTVYFSLLGAALSISTFADSAGTSMHMLTLGLTLGLLVMSYMLIGNLESMKEVPPDGDEPQEWERED